LVLLNIFPLPFHVQHDVSVAIQRTPKITSAAWPSPCSTNLTAALKPSCPS